MIPNWKLIVTHVLMNSVQICDTTKPEDTGEVVLKNGHDYLKIKIGSPVLTISSRFRRKSNALDKIILNIF